jgi:hypothetical protein
MAFIRKLWHLFIGMLKGLFVGMIIGHISGPFTVPIIFRLFNKNSYDPYIEGAVLGSLAGIVIGCFITWNALGKEESKSGGSSI